MDTERRGRKSGAAGLAGWVALAGALGLRSAGAAGPIDFNRDIRPLLSDRCFTCHGPDAGQRQAGLRLDDRTCATAPLASGAAAIVPGEPGASALVARITSTDPDVVMPPPHVAKPVTAAEAERLREWVAAGAPFTGHWAFERVERPALPAAADDGWCRTPVDRFIRASLAEVGLTPNPEADRHTLARRLALDLTGLPPEPDAVAAFVADRDEGAVERYVDTLLASPHFGERMALEWLDAARYADSHGYQTDSSRSNWPWRDWVIDAYNRNLPFDRFTIEQLAGDMLPGATTEQRVATGFNRNHRINGEGGIIAEEWRVETVIDRVETTGQTWLGLTVGCARCHDHKYDPLSQRDFYALFAIFNNVPENGTIMGPSNRRGGNSDPLERLPSASQVLERRRMEEDLAAAERALAAEQPLLPERAAAWEETVRSVLAAAGEAWIPVDAVAARSTGGATFRRADDGTWHVEGPLPARDTYELTLPTAAAAFSGVRLEVLPDPALGGGGGFGRAGNGNIVVTHVEVAVVPAGGAAAEPVPLVRAEADYEQSGWPAAEVLTPSADRGWAIDGNDPERRMPRRLAVFPAAPVAAPAGAAVRVTIRQEAFDGHAIGRFRLALTALDPGLVGPAGLKLPAPVRRALAVARGERTAAEQEAVAAFHRDTIDGPFRRAVAARDAARKALDELTESLPSAMVMVEGPRRQAHLLTRGEYDKPAEVVDPALPAFLAGPPGDGVVDRLALARWIASCDNPLTARVWVNRLWERFFGTGLVRTSENLGSQAEYPSHPALLDWLAVEFMEPGQLPAVGGQPAGPWDMKALVKLLVTSAVYRQSAAVTPQHLARDPANRLLARFPRVRLPGEIVRDQALAAAGLLVPRIGGPSVRPWMPDGVWDETSKYGDLRGYVVDTGPDRWRRGMYTIWKRTAGPPTMLLFDAPNRETCTVRRARTNTPLQALALLNEPTFVEAAHGLARRMLADAGPDPAARIDHAFRLVLARPAAAEELATLVAGYAADRARFAAEFAACSLAASVILNLDECVMRE
ncbi:MAG: DUF1553 domain-containing protein [Planctomycetia bacterium]|nr:DUF1553 domain-containing protein [Planctomycetia bacterium]